MNIVKHLFCISVWVIIFFAGCDDGGGGDKSNTSPSAPQLSSISPTNSCNLGPVSISGIAGSGFREGITVVLTKAGEVDIEATNVAVVDAGQLTCDFELAGAATGEWTVQVSDSYGADELAGAFTVTNALYVSQTGDNANTGTASSPKLTVQAAIDSASSGQHVRVSAGTYNITSNINLKNNVSLYGGYDPVTWERDYELYTTTIEDTRIEDSGSPSTESDPYTVLYAGSTVSVSTVIDGFTLQASTAGAANTAAIHCEDLSSSGRGPTIRNNSINGGSGSYSSRGILLEGYLNTPVENNYIHGGNGGIFSYALNGRLNSNVKIRNNIIIGGGDGQSYAMNFTQNSNLYVYNNVMIGGSGTFTYGVYLMSTGSVFVRNNTIISASGGVFRGIYIRNTEPHIDNNIISCSGTTSGYGIDVYVNSADPVYPASTYNNDIFDCSLALYCLSGDLDELIDNLTDLNDLTFADSNISIDPSFSDPGSDDYHLTSSTDATVAGGGLNGTDESWAYFPENGSGNPVDKDSVERPASGSSWAMGAYEYVP